MSILSLSILSHSTLTQVSLTVTKTAETPRLLSVLLRKFIFLCSLSLLFRMESEEHILMSELNEKIFQIFSDFMTRVIKFEELVAVGSRLLVGFHQRLEFIRRPPINKTSELIERIFRANETRRVLTYVEAGCVNAHDSIQNISNLHTCQLGLHDHLSKGSSARANQAPDYSKCIVNELEGLVKEVTGAMRTANESKPLSQDKVTQDEFGPEATLYDKEETVSSELPKPEHTDYAAMMSVIYSMVKLDYIMQVLSSLMLCDISNLKIYCLLFDLMVKGEPGVNLPIAV
ncbi:uncharacterized protein LOC114281581 [Camellia sinensis]|uniref:uncharacterized protein LOC114281581 n=1 Tax=Camellia sinensis TaxID=4442 RepID=UPI0010362C77|nr:uncharacterized protein LOC114281581 [Camellia sinensis]